MDETSLKSRLYAANVLTAIAVGLRKATVGRLKVQDLTTTALTLTVTGLAADSSLAGGNNPRSVTPPRFGDCTGRRPRDLASEACWVKCTFMSITVGRRSTLWSRRRCCPRLNMRKRLHSVLNLDCLASILLRIAEFQRSVVANCLISPAGSNTFLKSPYLENVSQCGKYVLGCHVRSGHLPRSKKPLRAKPFVSFLQRASWRFTRTAT